MLPTRNQLWSWLRTGPDSDETPTQRLLGTILYWRVLGMMALWNVGILVSMHLYVTQLPAPYVPIFIFVGGVVVGAVMIVISPEHDTTLEYTVVETDD